MALSTETARWLEALRASGHIDEAVLVSLRTAAEGKAGLDEFFKGSVLRQDDYSRNMADVKKAKDQIEAVQAEFTKKEAAVTKYQTEVATWQTGAQAKLTKAIQERDTAAAKLKKVGEDYGLSEEEVKLDFSTTNPEPAKGRNGLDLEALKKAGYLTRDEVSEFVGQSALLDATIHDLAVQHLELFGKPLTNAAALVTEAMAAKKPLTEFWAGKFDVPKRREELAEERVQGRIKEAEKAIETRIRSEEHLPASRPDLAGSPVFTHKLEPPKTEDVGGGGVSAAMAAFSAGKYRK